MAITVSGAAKWHPQAIVSDGLIRLDYQCATCRASNTVTLQPPPWSVPVLADDEALSLGHDNDPARQSAMNRLETRRAAGQIEHEQQDEVTTQLWCHRCQTGADVTLRG